MSNVKKRFSRRFRFLQQSFVPNTQVATFPGRINSVVATKVRGYSSGAANSARNKNKLNEHSKEQNLNSAKIRGNREEKRSGSCGRIEEFVISRSLLHPLAEPVKAERIRQIGYFTSQMRSAERKTQLARPQTTSSGLTKWLISRLLYIHSPPGYLQIAPIKLQ